MRMTSLTISTSSVKTLTRPSNMSALTLFITIIIIVAAGSEAEVTSLPDYDYDYNATFGYTFYSNTSSEDLEKFLKNTSDFLDSQEDWQEDHEEEASLTTATEPYKTPGGGVVVYNAASLCVCQDVMLMFAVIVQLHRSL
ncbi:uncharacterized protein si:ch211-191i18.2 [Dunckerocampus dactyliophorus]|uniref:uncharacterized protein si:ch211-191i18.2 n=1 Tax=Dunckerocampus dactyliophorus TaxID=161453 RepID=UPI00240526B2|nr:uncharacterized protein si:ch211-191i18.2 [Dunckerocampus dactyliophorus]